MYFHLKIWIQLKLLINSSKTCDFFLRGHFEWVHSVFSKLNYFNGTHLHSVLRQQGKQKNGLNIIFLLETYVSLLEKKLKIIFFELQISYAIESGPTDELDFYFHAKVRLQN